MILVAGSALEVALTGTAQPVLMHVSPQLSFDFDECPAGEHVDQLCTLTNDSAAMAITYQFRRVAHFVANKPNGKIKPGETIEVMFSFKPSQVGELWFRQHVLLNNFIDAHQCFVLCLYVSFLHFHCCLLYFALVFCIVSCHIVLQAHSSPLSSLTSSARWRTTGIRSSCI